MSNAVGGHDRASDEATDERFLGIDFSGGAPGWKRRCSRPNVWIATIDAEGLSDLRPVQELQGEGTPFDRLVELLAAGDFRAAGIDAPFSIPARHMPAGGHRALLTDVAAMEAANDRPFPRGAALVEYAVEIARLERAQPLRATEQIWRSRRVNVRSTLWNGPRGGAPFAIACLTLLARSGRPVWPWSECPGMLVEAFPAAQLRQWDLPFSGYADGPGRSIREGIAAALDSRIRIPEDLRAKMLSSSDALDAVLASFGAMAAAGGSLGVPLPAEWEREGAIAVYS